MANGLNERKYMSLLEDNKTAAESDINTPHGQVVAGYYTTAAPTLANTDFGFLRLTSDGKLMVDTELTVDGNVIIDNVAVFSTDLTSANTSFALVDAAGHQQVDVLTMPGGLTGYAEDSAHTTGEFGTMMLAVRNDAGTSLVDTDGDYAPLQVNSAGLLNVNYDMIRDVAPDVNVGAASAGTPRMVLASDDPAVVSLAVMDDWDNAASDGASVSGDVAHDSVDAGEPVKIGLNAQDPTSLPAAVAVADRVNAIGDVYGRQVVYLGTSLDATNDEVSVTPRDTSHNNTTAYATNLVVKASAGKLFEIRGYNSLASAQFIQVHDAASLPADTTVPEEVFTVSASSNFSISFPQGKVFSVGIVICNSSTGPTKTIGAADCWFSSDFE